MQGLGGGHRHKPLLVRASEKNGNPHHFVPLIYFFRHSGMHQKCRPVISFYIISRFRVRSLMRAPRNDDHAGIPIRLISQCSSIPEFSFTRARTVSPRDSISWPVAAPVWIRKLQCISDTCAPPTRKPRQPAASISFQALSPSGFLKVEPPVFSRIGCAVSRWFCTSFIRPRIASGAAISPRKRAEVKTIEGSTPLLR